MACCIVQYADCITFKRIKGDDVMTITKKGKNIFFEAYRMVDLPFEQWDSVQELLSKASRIAATHQRYAVFECNGCTREKFQFEDWDVYYKRMESDLATIEKKGERLDDIIKTISAALPQARLETQGDPRGATVCLVVSCDDGIERTYYFR